MSPDTAIIASAARSQALSRSRLVALSLAGLTIVALLLRLDGFTAQSLWWDEVSSWQQARLDWPQLLAATAADNYPPLHNLLLHLSMQLFGETAFALRLPSVLIGALAVPALYWAGVPLVGRAAALVAAVLLCLSQFHIWYAQEARMYALLCTATIVYAGAALRVALRPSWFSGTLGVLAGALLLYSHPYGALNWLALTFAVASWQWRTGGWRPVLRFGLLAAATGLLFAPWVLILLGRAKVLDETGFWIPSPTPASILYCVEMVLSGTPLLVLAAGALAAVSPGAPHLPRLLEATGGERPAASHGAALWIVLVWALAPLAMGVVLSLVAVPVVIPRYLIGSLPAALLLAGMGMARLPRNAIGLAAMLGLTAIALLGFLRFTVGTRDDFRDIAAYFATALRPGDCVVMSAESQIAMAYYRPQGFGCLAVPQNPSEARFGSIRPQRIFVILTGTNPFADPGVGGLGQLVETRHFGVTDLLEITPAQ